MVLGQIILLILFSIVMVSLAVFIGVQSFIDLKDANKADKTT